MLHCLGWQAVLLAWWHRTEALVLPGATWLRPGAALPAAAAHAPGCVPALVQAHMLASKAVPTPRAQFVSTFMTGSVNTLS
jgi:hypothetical protein